MPCQRVGVCWETRKQMVWAFTVSKNKRTNSAGARSGQEPQQGIKLHVLHGPLTASILSQAPTWLHPVSAHSHTTHTHTNTRFPPHTHTHTHTHSRSPTPTPTRSRSPNTHVHAHPPTPTHAHAQRSTWRPNERPLGHTSCAGGRQAHLVPRPPAACARRRCAGTSAGLVRRLAGAWQRRSGPAARACTEVAGTRPGEHAFPPSPNAAGAVAAVHVRLSVCVCVCARQ